MCQRLEPVFRGWYDRFDLWLTPILTDCILDALDWLTGRE